MTITTDTSIDFDYQDTVELETNFGPDAEYYEQHGVTFAISFQEGPAQVYPIERSPSGKLRATEPEHEFDWQSAEAFRGGPFPQDDYYGKF